MKPYRKNHKKRTVLACSNVKTIVPTSALTMLFFLCVSTSAETIKATGEAAITGAPSYAREMAYKDALHQISQTHGLAISGQQSMHNGELVDDQLTIESRSNIQRADIIHEESVDGVYRVTVSADVSEIPQCQQASNNYQKSVVVLGFPLLHPEQAMLGNIEDIERELPAVFRQSLLTQSSVSQSTKLSVKTLPTFYGDQLSPSGLIDLARDNDAQYVVTGQMLDVSTGIEENDNFGFLLGRKSLGMTRQFAFEITLFDGFSGQVLSSNQYRTQGQWTMASNQRVGFNSPRFQQMDYGQQVTRLLQQASRDVNKSLACAPFMAKIRQASGRRLVIDAGTASGIRPGDQLSVYRTSTQFDARQQITTQLHRTPIQAMVKQVQPDMVIADTGVLNSHFSIQQDDVIIVW